MDTVHCFNLVNRLVKKYPNYIVNLDRMDTCSSMNNCKESEGKPNYVYKRRYQSADFMNYVLKEENIDTIIHAAACNHMLMHRLVIRLYLHSNVYGTHVIIEAAKINKIKGLFMCRLTKCTEVVGMSKK